MISFPWEKNRGDHRARRNRGCKHPDNCIALPYFLSYIDRHERFTRDRAAAGDGCQKDGPPQQSVPKDHPRRLSQSWSDAPVVLGGRNPPAVKPQ
jgi:hypothetical protein